MTWLHPGANPLFSLAASYRMQRADRRRARQSQPGSILFSPTQTDRSTTSPSRATRSRTAPGSPPMWVCNKAVSAKLYTKLFPLPRDSRLSVRISMHAVLIHSAHRDLNLLFPCLLFCWLRLSCISSYFHLSPCPRPSLETYQSVPSAERVQQYLSVSV